MFQGFFKGFSFFRRERRGFYERVLPRFLRRFFGRGVGEGFLPGVPYVFLYFSCYGVCDEFPPLFQHSKCLTDEMKAP